MAPCAHVLSRHLELRACRKVAGVRLTHEYLKSTDLERVAVCAKLLKLYGLGHAPCDGPLYEEWRALKEVLQRACVSQICVPTGLAHVQDGLQAARRGDDGQRAPSAYCQVVEASVANAAAPQRAFPQRAFTLAGKKGSSSVPSSLPLKTRSGHSRSCIGPWGRQVGCQECSRIKFPGSCSAGRSQSSHTATSGGEMRSSLRKSRQLFSSCHPPTARQCALPSLSCEPPPCLRYRWGTAQTQAAMLQHASRMCRQGRQRRLSWKKSLRSVLRHRLAIRPACRQAMPSLQWAPPVALW
jgi:hypothetical protein